MTLPRIVRTRGCVIAAPLLLAAVIALLMNPTAWAHPETPARSRAICTVCSRTGPSRKHSTRLSSGSISGATPSSSIGWLENQESAERLSEDTHLYLNALLGLGEPEHSLAAAPANYSGNGNVTLLGRLDSQPPNPYYGDNSSTGTLYNRHLGLRRRLARVRAAVQQLRPAHHRRHRSRPPPSRCSTSTCRAA